jgi:hypothetical protein
MILGVTSGATLSLEHYVADPKAFISYSWTTPKHEQWVIDLANQLVESGVEVILDKWDLREGHDAVQFMEAMVTDPSVNKVIVVSDKNYAEKADKRKGGVGTESQIMSPDIYKKADQTKFVAVVSELDSNGEPYLPTFLRSRIYIDMTESRYATNFEQLLRWLYDKPLNVKPPLGKMPEFLNEDSVPSPTRTKVRRAVEIIQTSPASASASTESYLDALAGALEDFRIPPERPDFPQAVLDNIESFLPHRNEFIEFMVAAASGSNTELPKTLQRFFERIIPLMSRPESVSSYRDWDFDNFIFIVHELFLYTIAVLLRYERFETLNEFLNLGFYVPNDNSDDVMKQFTVIRRFMKALEPKRQELRRASLRADLLEKRSHVSGLKFSEVMTADFVLFIRSASFDQGRNPWYPETLLYSTFGFRGPLEAFARSESKAYFNRFSPVIAWNSKAALEGLISTYSRDGSAGRALPSWEFEALDIGRLANIAKLESRP